MGYRGRAGHSRGGRWADVVHIRTSLPLWKARFQEWRFCCPRIGLTVVTLAVRPENQGHQPAADQHREHRAEHKRNAAALIESRIGQIPAPKGEPDRKPEHDAHGCDGKPAGNAQRTLACRLLLVVHAIIAFRQYAAHKKTKTAPPYSRRANVPCIRGERHWED